MQNISLSSRDVVGHVPALCLKSVPADLRCCGWWSLRLLFLATDVSLISVFHLADWYDSCLIFQTNNSESAIWSIFVKSWPYAGTLNYRSFKSDLGSLSSPFEMLSTFIWTTSFSAGDSSVLDEFGILLAVTRSWFWWTLVEALWMLAPPPLLFVVPLGVS